MRTAVFKWLRNRKMKTKLMLLYYPLTLISITCVGVLAYWISSNAVMEQSLQIISQSQKLICSDISSKVNSIHNTLDSFCLDTSKNRTLKGGFYRIYDETVNMQATKSSIASVLEALGIDSNLTMIRSNSSDSESIGKNFHGLLETIPDASAAMNGNAIQIINWERIASRDWASRVSEKKDEFLWLQIDKDAEYGYYTIVRWAGSGIANSYNGLYLLTVKLKDIIDIELLSNREMLYFYMILDSNGTVIFQNENHSDFYHNNREEIETFRTSGDSTAELDGAVILKDRIPKNGWTVLCVVPLSGLNDKPKRIGSVVLISCIAAGVLLFGVSMLLAHTFSKRINRICRHMQEFQTGKFSNKVTITHQDELGYLDAAFNEMTTKTSLLIEQVYKAKIDMKGAQLRALQAQINPHFLYNSLSIIGRLSDLGEKESIKEMVFSLATFYRMTLNKGKDIISVSDEISQIKAYVSIYKIRLEDRIQAEYDFDPDILSCETVKVILQPFVENIFEHAMGEEERTIHIKISGKPSEEGKKIVFTVQDDGEGIEEERLSTLLYSEAMSSSGYGIKNVNERIKMYYGEEYGVVIESELSKGTTVTIYIPKKSL